MSVFPFLLATVQPLPEQAPAAAEALADTAVAAVAAGASPEGMNYLALFLQASWPVKVVMLLLVAASVASWVIIFRKKAVLDRAQREADAFEERFWSGGDLGRMYEDAHSRAKHIGGLEAIFESGMREFQRARQRRGIDARGQLEGAQRAMRATSARELDGLEHNLEFLANVGSISPYIGLFGTVLGIMVSFHGLTTGEEAATLEKVAPGISEALFATAIGLFAAIPAVWAYNRFATRVERIASRYDTFSEEFASILQRQAHLDDA